jgi:peroxisomal enoyl-CoA hydratase 2
MKKQVQSSLPDFPRSVRVYCLRCLPIDWSRGVDGERYIEVFKPIPTTSKGKNFELRRETIGAYDKGKVGLVLEEQTLLVDASTGEIYTKMIGSAFFVGQVHSQ